MPKPVMKISWPEVAPHNDQKCDSVGGLAVLWFPFSGEGDWYARHPAGLRDRARTGPADPGRRGCLAALAGPAFRTRAPGAGTDRRDDAFREDQRSEEHTS